jgi:hypothetical protein
MWILFALACTRAPTPDDDATVDGPPDDPAVGETVAPADTAATDTPTPEAPPAPRVIVNEIAAANRGSVRAPDGDVVDWIELYNPELRDVDLSGWTLSDDFTEPDKAPLPDGTVLPAGGFLVFWADDLSFGLAQEGEGVGLHRRDGTLSDWVTFPGQRDDTAWARLPDGDGTFREVQRGTPGAPNAELRVQELTLLPLGATWRYWDRREAPDAAWPEPTFDDAAWPQGAAPLGYGDPSATVLDFGADEGNKPITAWFRATFDAPVTVEAPTLTLRVDDGAAVWLDGALAAQFNLPAPPWAADTLALSSVSGGAELAPLTYTLGPIAAGTHTLAVEVHQSDPGSSDLMLELGLAAVTWAP